MPIRNPFLSHRPSLSLLLLSSLAFMTAAYAQGGGQEGVGFKHAGEVQDLQERLRHAEALAGLTPLEGPGLEVTLRHSPKPAPRGVDRRNFMVRERDVNAVLNALRIAGAEALAIAGASDSPQAALAPERVTATTVLRESPTGLLVNGVELRPPYRISAIGAGAAMRTELFRPGGVVKNASLDLLQMVEAQELPEVVIPALRQAPELRFARVSDGSPVRTPQPYIARRVPGVTPPRTGATPPRTGATEPGANGTRIASVPSTAFTPTGAPDRNPGGASTTLPKLPGSETGTQPAGNGVQKPAPMVPEKAPVVKVEKSTAPLEVTKPIEPARSTTPTAPKTTLATGTIYGGKGLAKYHIGPCRFGERVEPGQRVTFGTVEEATRAGRQPCRICCPDAK